MWQGGKPLYRCAVGWLDAATRQPMRDDALFRIFSMTKPLVSVNAMQWVSRGALRLDDEAIKFLPELGHRHITIRHLLTHTAGLGYGPRQSSEERRRQYAELGLGIHPRNMDRSEFLKAISRAPLSAAPGTQWDYGYATDVLGLVIEQVSGRRLSTELQNHLFEPLGMHETTFSIALHDAARLAQPMVIDPANGALLVVPDQTYDPYQSPRMDSGGAGAISTAEDYGRFANWLLTGSHAEGIEILHHDLRTTLLQDQLGPRGLSGQPDPGESALNSPGFGFGFGVAVRLPGHGANLPGNSGTFLWSGTAGTFFWVDPSLELVVVYMSQSPGASRQRFRRLMMELVYGALDA